jgi:ATP-dependent helicase/nuclease subunit B
MQVQFLLGAAGSGKTFRCLSEIRERLIADPTGAPLVLLAPKQATFQLERQLLNDPDVHGFTRLQIIPFDRLSHYVLETLASLPPRLLDEQGRVMVLRALLTTLKDDLEVYAKSATRPGLAVQLSDLLREFQRNQISPAQLAKLAEEPGLPALLRNKLTDLGLLFRNYTEWLERQHVQDSDALLDLAAARLAELRSEARLEGGKNPLVIEHLWLDGFAEMTPQEEELLAAVVPFCQGATLAFCMDADTRETPHWNSLWSVIGHTFFRCRQRLERVKDCEVSVEVLKVEPAQGRYSASVDLQKLERAWRTGESPEDSEPPTDVRLARCANPEAEATFVAREILRHVQDGGRYRQTAVLLRSLDDHLSSLRRVFARYGIPYFLDQREAVSHHPLAELTRFALRTVEYNWRNDDWFGALKSGLIGLRDDQVDLLENTALANGWSGHAWRKKLSVAGSPALSEQVEEIRTTVVPAFERLAKNLESMPLDTEGESSELASELDYVDAPLLGLMRPDLKPAEDGVAVEQGERVVSARQLVRSITGLWEQLEVSETLERWSRKSLLQSSGVVLHHEPEAIHTTVWRQLNDMLGNLELAFPDECLRLSLRQWLPILEAGMSGLTVGVIPPALDQVLIGAVDRSRNPELSQVFAMGWNEGIIPAPPSAPLILTDRERELLADRQTRLGLSERHSRGHERYLAYVLATRASERFTVTYSAGGAEGGERQPSIYVNDLKRLCPGLIEEVFCGVDIRGDTLSPVELVGEVLRAEPGSAFERFADYGYFKPIRNRWLEVETGRGVGRLEEMTRDRVVGDSVGVSVSSLEQFAECPFKFFAAKTLGADEREEFEVTPRERGSFQHEILERFHDEVRDSDRHWRDVSVEDAREMVARLGEIEIHKFENGLFASEAGRTFQARTMISNLQDLIESMVGWMGSYAFDPIEMELSFGNHGDSIPAWDVEVAEGRKIRLRGRIDRLDLLAREGRSWAVIVDYKSSGKQLEAWRLKNGLQLQLPFYLLALTKIPEIAQHFDVERVVPAGVFYVALRSKATAVSNRGEQGGGIPFRHSGMFDAELIDFFDSGASADNNSGQFKFRVNKDGSPTKGRSDGVPQAQFNSMLERADNLVEEFGGRILEGDIAALPFKHNRDTACEWCEFRGICRFDPWESTYRVM